MNQAARRGRWLARRILVGIGLWFAAASYCAADEPASAADDVVILRELRYRPGTSKHCTLDLAMPRERGKPLPTIVVIHGGGWVEGDKSSFSTKANPPPGNVMDFARAGFVSATINYTMSGEAPYPAALDDCRCAIRWLRAQAAEHQIDAQRIGVWGNSAGGHLALLLAMTHDDPDKREPYADQSSAVQAAASDSGPLDLLVQHQNNQLRGVIEKFMGGPPSSGRAGQYKIASPIHHISGKTPPLLLIYGEVDGQVDVKTADDFVAALGRAGRKDVTYIRLANIDHCPHSLIRVPFLQQVVIDFFRRTLAGF